MVVDKKRVDAGSIVELPYRDYVYLANHDRVFDATDENVALVKAELKGKAELAARNAQPSEAEQLKARIAELEAKLAEAKKSK